MTIDKRSFRADTAYTKSSVRSDVRLLISSQMYETYIQIIIPTSTMKIHVPNDPSTISYPFQCECGLSYVVGLEDTVHKHYHDDYELGPTVLQVRDLPTIAENGPLRLVVVDKSVSDKILITAITVCPNSTSRLFQISKYLQFRTINCRHWTSLVFPISKYFPFRITSCRN